MTGITTIILLCTLAKRELAIISDNKEEVPNTPPPEANSPGPMKALKGPSASIDFRHMRSLSKNFLTKLDPPTPIPESPLNPFEPVAPSTQRPVGMYHAGRRGQRNG